MTQYPTPEGERIITTAPMSLERARQILAESKINPDMVYYLMPDDLHREARHMTADQLEALAVWMRAHWRQVVGSYWAERKREYLRECYFCGRKHPCSEVDIGRWECYGGLRVSENWWVFLASKFDNMRMYFWCCRWCLPVALEQKEAMTGPFDYGMPQWYIDQAKDYA